MKIGINGRFLLSPFTGIGVYTQNLFLELSRLDKKNTYVFVVPSAVDASVRRLFPKNVQFKTVSEPKLGSKGMKKTWWEQISVPEFFVKEGVKVAIFPYPCNPWTKDWYMRGIKTIVTVHDCIPWIDENYKKGFVSRMYHLRTKMAVKFADVVLTVSETSKKKIANICGVDKTKIHVLHNGVSSAYKEEKTSNVLGEFGLKKRKYILYVGGYDVRKNVGYMVEEYLKFNDKHGDIPLVMVGGAMHKGKLYDSFEINGKGIVKTGFLEEADLVTLATECLFFVNLSKEEGFNIPALQAATCGAPLVLSDIDVHSELYGECALLVNIKKSGWATKAFEKILDKNLQKKMRAKSLKLAKKYSFNESAKSLKKSFL